MSDKEAENIMKMHPQNGKTEKEGAKTKRFTFRGGVFGKHCRRFVHSVDETVSLSFLKLRSSGFVLVWRGRGVPYDNCQMT